MLQLLRVNIQCDYVFVCFDVARADEKVSTALLPFRDSSLGGPLLDMLNDDGFRGRPSNESLSRENSQRPCRRQLQLLIAAHR